MIWVRKEAILPRWNLSLPCANNNPTHPPQLPVKFPSFCNIGEEQGCSLNFPIFMLFRTVLRFFLITTNLLSPSLLSRMKSENSYFEDNVKIEPLESGNFVDIRSAFNDKGSSHHVGGSSKSPKWICLYFFLLSEIVWQTDYRLLYSLIRKYRTLFSFEISTNWSNDNFDELLRAVPTLFCVLIENRGCNLIFQLSWWLMGVTFRVSNSTYWTPSTNTRTWFQLYYRVSWCIACRCDEKLIAHYLRGANMREDVLHIKPCSSYLYHSDTYCNQVCNIRSNNADYRISLHLSAKRVHKKNALPIKEELLLLF